MVTELRSYKGLGHSLRSADIKHCEKRENSTGAPSDGKETVRALQGESER